MEKVPEHRAPYFMVLLLKNDMVLLLANQAGDGGDKLARQKNYIVKMLIKHTISPVNF